MHRLCWISKGQAHHGKARWVVSVSHIGPDQAAVYAHQALQKYFELILHERWGGREEVLLKMGSLALYKMLHAFARAESDLSMRLCFR